MNQEIENIGVIDGMNKNGCGVATKVATWNPLSMIGYDQFGTYEGDMSGYKSGDKIKFTYRKSSDSFLERIKENLFKGNIIKIEKVNLEKQT